LKILVAGGTGFIGQAVTSLLGTCGHTLTVLSRNPQPARGRLPGTEILPWDGKSVGPWRSALDNCEAIINLAGVSIGASRWSSSFKEKVVASRVHSTTVLLEASAAARHGPKVLVNASAVGFYGHVPAGEVSESSPPGNDFLAETCRQWERSAMRAGEIGIRVVLMRTGFVIGRSAPAFRKMMMPYRFFAGGILGAGTQWFPWIHIDDVAAAYRFAVENEEIHGPVNVTAPNPPTSAEFSRTLGKILGRPAWLPVPSWGLRIVLGEMSDLLLKGQRAVPQKLLAHGFSFRFPDAESALKEVLA